MQIVTNRVKTSLVCVACNLTGHFKCCVTFKYDGATWSFGNCVKAGFCCGSVGLQYAAYFILKFLTAKGDKEVSYLTTAMVCETAFKSNGILLGSQLIICKV